DDGGLLGEGNPDVQTGDAVRLDVVFAQSCEEGIAALGVGRVGVGELLVDALVAPEIDDEALQDVADPTDAERLAAFDAGDRSLVAGENGQSQIGSERFRYGADDGPALPRRFDESDVLRAGDGTGVVVFDDEEIGSLPEQGSQLPPALL